MVFKEKHQEEKVEPRMKASHILILFSFVLSSAYADEDEKRPWNCKQVESMLRVKVLPEANIGDFNYLDVWSQYVECYKCDLLLWRRFTKEDLMNKSDGAFYDAHYRVYFEVILPERNEVICSKFSYNDFKECGLYELEIAGKDKCSIKNVIKPNDTIGILFAGLALILGLIILSCLYEKYRVPMWKAIDNFIEKKIYRENLVEPDAELQPVSKQDKTEPKKPVKVRIHSVDTFRGANLILMIYIIYGFATYSFMYQLPWHGLNMTCIVFPWFVWIMGCNIPTSINSLMRKPDANRLKIFVKILWRTIKLFFIGLALNIPYDWEFYNIRIFGVLQRIGLTYLVVATVELIFYKKINPNTYANTWLYYFSEFIYTWPHTIVISLITLLWFLLTYLLPVPGCPTGYLGAGGLEDGGKYFNCTGGAAGYIDLVIMGREHLYPYPTSITMYKTDAFEPEGILGTLTSIFLCYIGTFVGRTFLFYKSQKHHIINWLIWCVVTLVLFFALCQGDLFEGTIPVNKNLWTFTLMLVSASSGFIILAILYFIIDVKKWWTGSPFYYTGMNSIFVYVCMNIFIDVFPVQWKTPQLHGSKLFMSTWGSTFWTLIAIYFYYENVFINI